MKTGFSIGYPWWFIVFCLLLGGLYAFLLYRKSPLFQAENKLQSFWKYLLSIFRFLTASILAFLLLSPVFKHFTSKVEQPIILFAEDNSASIKMGFKGSQENDFQNAMRELKEKLASKYIVKTYTFGQEVKQRDTLKYDESATDINEALDVLYNKYDNQNIGAVILASDGLYNKGMNPLYNKKLNALKYTVALGDTTTRKDIKLENVYHSKVAYLGDKISLQAEVFAEQCMNESGTVTLSQLDGGNRVISSQTFTINSNKMRYNTTYVVDADRAGIHHYRIAVSAVPDEISTANNSKDIFIEVIDEKIKVLLLANAPHPDIAAIKQAAESLRNYEVTTSFITKFQGDIKSYDMVILHNLPSSKNAISTLLNEINIQKIPTLYILGTQTLLSSFNNAQRVLKINGANSTNEVTASPVSSFTSFTTDANELNAIAGFPALLAPYGSYSISPTAKTLLMQKIGNVVTSYPLLTFDEIDGHKIGVLAAENIWRWRMNEYLKTQKQDITNNLITKTIQYITVKKNKQNFRVYTSKNTYLSNEVVHFDASLYNEAKELINTPEVKLKITNDQGLENDFTMSKNGSAYYLDAGNYSEGVYNWSAVTMLNGKTFTATGSFTILGIQLEAISTKADHQLLYNIANDSKAKMYYPQQLKALEEELMKNEKIQPVLFSQFESTPLLHQKWIFFLLLLLLSLEWFVRKYIGGY